MKELFRSALEHEVDERGAFLKSACDGDEGLRREIESLLSSFEESDRIIEAPVAWSAADLFSEHQSDSLVGKRLGHYADGRTILFTRVDSSAADLTLVENFR